MWLKVETNIYHINYTKMQINLRDITNPFLVWAGYVNILFFWICVYYYAFLRGFNFLVLHVFAGLMRDMGLEINHMAHRLFHFICATGTSDL